jgi:antitoxin HicB
MAQNALLTAMEFHFDGKCSVLLPSQPQHRDVLIDLPPSIGADVLLLNARVADETADAVTAAPSVRS